MVFYSWNLGLKFRLEDYGGFFKARIKLMWLCLQTIVFKKHHHWHRWKRYLSVLEVQRYSYNFGLHGTICSKSIISTNPESGFFFGISSLGWISVRYPDNQREWTVWFTTGMWCCYSGQMIMIYTHKRWLITKWS